MCGRLLNFDVDKWVHANCALWTNEVKEHSDGALKNFLQAYKKAQQQVKKQKTWEKANLEGWNWLIFGINEKYLLFDLFWRSASTAVRQVLQSDAWSQVARINIISHAC